MDVFDRAEFERFYRANFRGFVAFANRGAFGSARAEDLAQEAMLRLWRRSEAVDRSTVRTYGYAILRNLVYDDSADRLRQDRALAGVAASRSALATDETDDVLLRNVVRDLVESLPDRQRDVVVLRLLCDLSEKETAQVLGVEKGTVKSTLNAAKRRLRESQGVLR